MHTQLVKVYTPFDLAVELGRRDVPAWWMRRVDGRDGLEAVVACDRTIRLELAEDLPDVAAVA